MFATSSSDATTMAWNWVIQSIAKFKQVDSSTLAGLVDKAPEISVDLGKDAKEMVSLQLLESLFLSGNDAMVDFDSGQSAKLSFDPSKHCEDIIHKISEETSEPMTELERRKWNIRPFIIHKNASFSKTPVQKFKEALIDGNHLILESLKEMSKLEGIKVSEDTIPEVDNLVFLKTEKKKSKLQKSPLQKPDHLEVSNIGFTEDIGRKEHEMTIVPPKNNLGDDDDNVDHGQQLPHGKDGDDLVFLKNENGNSKLQECALQKPDHVEDSNKEFTKDIGRKEHEMTKKPPENDLVDDNVDHGQQLPRGEDDDLVFLKTENENSKLQECPLQKPDHVEDSNIGIAEDIGRKERKMTIEPQENDLENDNNNVEHGQQSPDDDENNDEMTDIAAKKEAFLSSQFTQSQDFISTVDFSEIYLCMKCNKGGQLLACKSDACPFKVHERCLGLAATFDENEVFFCPFCSYSHAISKYMEVKKKASFARKDLQAFLTSGVKHKPIISSKTCENIKLDVNEHFISRGKDCAPVDSLHLSTRLAGVDNNSSKDKESPGSSTSSHSKRARKQEPQYTSTTIILPRRRNFFWEKSEEEKLKEGMKRFSNEDNKRIPWKKILDFGRDIFDKSRTTVDLKDKWRNMFKENESIKKQKL